MKIKKIIQLVWSKITDQPIEEEFGFLCCFCNKAITSLDSNPSDINIIANINKSKEQQADQYFYCHLECFKNKLHYNTKKHLILDDGDRLS